MSKRSFLILSTGLFVVVLGIILAYPYRYAIAKRLYRQVNPPPAAREPHPSVGHVYGIDVSHHQDKIDWSQVRQWKGHPIEFVYIKASEGTTLQDNRYAENIQGARANGLRVGSYHYFTTLSSVQSQFENFIAQVDLSQQDLIPMIDLEEMNHWKGEEYHAKLSEFLTLVEAHFGKKPLIYTFNTFYNRNLRGRYRQYHFLIARYGKESPWMRDGSNWTAWQFSEDGEIDGISERVDLDLLSARFSIEDLLLR